MRLLEIHTCPLWEDERGNRIIGMHHDPRHPTVVGWVNVIVVSIDGKDYALLLGPDADR